MRTKMPENNRVSSSIVLNTNDMWSKTIGYDPYASSKDKSNQIDPLLLLEQNESLLLLAKLSKASGNEKRGGCSKCGYLGHLPMQCRNIPVQTNKVNDLSDSDSNESDDSDENSITNKTNKRQREIEEDSDKGNRENKHHKENKDKHKKHKKSKSKKSKKEKKSKHKTK